MQESYIYAAARIRSQENKLIPGDKLRRMAQASLTDALRLLSESGYGGAVQLTAQNINAAIAEELAITKSFICEITPDKQKTDVFLMQTDITSLKLLLKLRCLNGSIEGVPLSTAGVFEPAELRYMVEHGDYGKLPKIISDTLTLLEIKLYDSPSPRLISVELDKAYISYALSVKDRFINEYYSIFSEYTNAIILLREREQKTSPERVFLYLLPGSSVTRELFMKHFEAPLDTLSRTMFENSPIRDALSHAFLEASRTNAISAIEKCRDNALMELAKRGRSECENLLPLFGYMHAKQQEAKAIRLVFTLKLSGEKSETILERLRELYV
ncbi:MAG: V-type ATPase subunit [Clostridia bacterium]|nr:V-type ATPase subunit [Clostridia bacterium]